jgi:hypothetical protein
VSKDPTIYGGDGSATLLTPCSTTLGLERVVIPGGWWSEWLQDVRCLRDLQRDVNL